MLLYHFSCGTFIDLQKAFDTVDHKILLSKLDNYGIRGLSNQWFNNYLSGRKQFVSIMNHSSSSAVISHGVPQGSVLGPLLFLIYINDLPSSIKYSTTFLFADDTGILYSSPDLKDIEEKVNFDLRCLSTWLKANKIALNTTKTEVILFRDPRKSITSPIKLFLDNFELSFSSNIKYLGIFLDQHLSFKHQAEFLATKLSRSNAILSRLRHFFPLKQLISIYFSLFQSHLSYGLQAYGFNILSKSRIRSLQKNALRLITFSNYRAPSRPLFEFLNIFDISELLFSFNIHLVYKCLNNLSPTNIQDTLGLCYHTHFYSTRSLTCKLLQRPKMQTEKYGINSIQYQCILNWNTLQSLYPNLDLSTLAVAKSNI